MATETVVSRHTSGPWSVKLLDAFDDDGKPIVGVWVEGPGEYNSVASLVPVAAVEANASLIAAAPDLLSALKGLMHPWGGVVATEDVIAAAKVAIAKAER